MEARQRLVEGPYGVWRSAPFRLPPATADVLRLAVGGRRMEESVEGGAADGAAPVSRLVRGQVQTTLSALGQLVPPKKTDRVRLAAQPPTEPPKPPRAARGAAPPLEEWPLLLLRNKEQAQARKRRERSVTPPAGPPPSPHDTDARLGDGEEEPAFDYGLPDDARVDPEGSEGEGEGAGESKGAEGQIAEGEPDDDPAEEPAAEYVPAPLLPLVPYAPGPGAAGAPLTDPDVDSIQTVIPTAALANLCPSFWTFLSTLGFRDAGAAAAARDGFNFLVLTAPWKVRIPAGNADEFLAAVHRRTGMCHPGDGRAASTGAFILAAEDVVASLEEAGVAHVLIEAYGMKTAAPVALQILEQIPQQAGDVIPAAVRLDIGRLHNPVHEDTIVLFRVAVIGPDGVEVPEPQAAVPRPAWMNEQHAKVGRVRYTVYASLGVLGRFTQGSVTVALVRELCAVCIYIAIDVTAVHTVSLAWPLACSRMMRP